MFLAWLWSNCYFIKAKNRKTIISFTQQHMITTTTASPVHHHHQHWIQVMTILKNNHHHYIHIHYQFFTLLISHHGGVLLFLVALPSATAQIDTEPTPPPADPFGSLQPKFEPSMAIIMVVLVSVFFLMGFFSIYIRQCARRHIRPSNSIDPYAIFMAGNNRRSRRVARGLEASVIETFPTFLYSAVKGLKIGKQSLECAVCLNEFEDDETLRLIPKCSHVFHPDCIDAWLASHTTCPVCRANVAPEPGETASSVDVQLFNPASNSGESDSIEEISHADVEQSQRGDLEAADVNLINQNRPRRSRSSGWRLGRLFPRSNSTGHSLVQAGENCERFTLRLPEEVRSELLMKSSTTASLSRSRSCVVFPRVRSSRRGFRTGSGGLGLPRNHQYYERFNSSSKLDRFGFSITPPCDSVRYSKEMLRGATATAGHEVNSSSSSTPPKTTLFKSVKSKSNSLLVGDDFLAERSFDHQPHTQV